MKQSTIFDSTAVHSANSVRFALKRAVEAEVVGQAHVSSVPEAFSRSQFSKSHGGIVPAEMGSADLLNNADADMLRTFAEELATQS